jgi:hypothetical protein
MDFNDVFKHASIRTAIYNANVRSEPRPKRPIPHFTPSTYTLLDQLRLNKPPPRNRLMKEDGTYFTQQEEAEFYYELEEFFEWMREHEEELEQKNQEDHLDGSYYK